MNTEKLKKIRLDLRMTQENMAAFLGCNRRTYQRYEAGSAIPTLLIHLLSYKVKANKEGVYQRV